MSETVYTTPAEIPLHGIWEASFQSEGQPPPTTDFVVALIAPSGRRTVRNGYWDGGTEWRVRFMPTEPGEWIYHTASHPVDPGLHRKHGRFICRRGLVPQPSVTASARAAHHAPEAYASEAPLITPWHEQITPAQSAAASRARAPAAAPKLLESMQAVMSRDNMLPQSTAPRDIEPLGDENLLLRHGPIRVGPGSHFLIHADGTPFFFLSDTAWNGPLLSTPSDWETYLDDRVAKGFTAIQFVTMAPWLGAYANAEGEVAYTGHPYFPVNPHFFRRLDQRINAINARGLVAVPVLLWAAPFGEAAGFNPGATLSEEQLIFIARYMVARYGGHHVLWMLAGDGRYGGPMAQRWQHIGRAIFDGTDHAPVGLHPCGLDWPYDDYRSEGWLDIAGYQSSHSDGGRTLHWIQKGPPALWWRMRPPRPLINLEPCYEDAISVHSHRPITRDAVRKASYWSLFNAPIAGISYGAHGVWGWESTTRVPLNHPTVGAARPWREAIHLPGSYDMRRLNDLIRSVDWWDLRPDFELLAAQPGKRSPGRFVSAVRSHTGDLALFYLPMGGEIEINLEKLVKERKGEWFDPRTGSRFAAQPVAPKKYRIPDEQDWILILK